MPKNLVYDLRPDEIQTVADKVRESELVWDAVEVWVKQRTAGTGDLRANLDLVTILENETDYYVNADREKSEEEGVDEHEQGISA